jgi:1-acyl-sn-glycerol-3-phosphate acyltransferase
MSDPASRTAWADTAERGRPTRAIGPSEPSLREPGAIMRAQRPVWDLLCKRYFRVEIEGWERVSDGPCLLVGVHAGAALTVDAWALVYAWWARFGEQRILHGTAHDVLMATPGLGHYFRACGVIPASRAGVSAALAAAHDVIVWPGGEQDAMRSWRKRDTCVLAGRKGFVCQAIRSGVPIVPVAAVGGGDTVFVLSEGRWLARASGLGRRLRGATLPIVAGVPLGIHPEILPMHLPLPAKLRYELLAPVEVDSNPASAADDDYVDAVYRRVESDIQRSMRRLAARRRFPLFG